MPDAPAHESNLLFDLFCCTMRCCVLAILLLLRLPFPLLFLRWRVLRVWLLWRCRSRRLC
jgi:hypothetical protein